MTARIYKIPAAHVVEGMLLNVALLDFVPVLAVTPCRARLLPADIIVPAITLDGSRFSLTIIKQDTEAQVTLPGPSPRELLCSCLESDEWRERVRALYPEPDGDWLAIVPPQEHLDDCTVRKLQLRLWPVGAEWKPYDGHDPSGTGGWWIVDGHMVDNDDLRDDFEGWIPPIAARLRAAFCEPEVQP